MPSAGPRLLPWFFPLRFGLHSPTHAASMWVLVIRFQLSKSPRYGVRSPIASPMFWLGLCAGLRFTGYPSKALCRRGGSYGDELPTSKRAGGEFPALRPQSICPGRTFHHRISYTRSARNRRPRSRTESASPLRIPLRCCPCSYPARALELPTRVTANFTLKATIASRCFCRTLAPLKKSKP